LFSGTFTYTFTSGVLSGGTLNGWSQTPPAIAAGEFLFLSLATASSTASTDSVAASEFSTPQVISGTGTNGANTAIVSLFQSNTSAVTPPASPTGTFTYTFATAALSGGTLNGWAQSAPTLTAGQYLWQKQATAYATTATDSIAASEFSGAVVVGGVGSNGGSGLAGITAQTGYKVQSQSTAAPTFTTPTSGSALPSGWYSTLALALSALSPPQSVVAVGQIIWYIQGQYNSNSVTVNGVGANTTAWTGPIAASVFQDIRSDNWNGSNPPSASTVSSWGTTGYYISQADGNMFANGFYARGVMQVNGGVYNPSFGYTTALNANSSGGSKAGIISYTNVTEGYGVVGWTDVASAFGGVNGTSTINGSVGVVANNTNGGIALDVAGKMRISNNTVVANLNASLLEGNPASAFYVVGGALGTPSSGNLANCTFPTLNQNTTGNAATATTAATATNVAYSGLTGTVPTWNQNTTGNAATATNVPYSGLTGTVPTWNQNTTGNAATATNVPYSGLTGTVPTWNQNTTGNAATATSALTATTAVNANVAGNSAQLGGYSAGNASGNVPISNGTLNTNLNADLLDGKHAAAFVNIAGATDNGKYLYYVNNTGAPSNPTTRAAWILISTNDGGTVYIPGYI
jgi:hypothetical protein